MAIKSDIKNFKGRLNHHEKSHIYLRSYSNVVIDNITKNGNCATDKIKITYLTHWKKSRFCLEIYFVYCTKIIQQKTVPWEEGWVRCTTCDLYFLQKKVKEKGELWSWRPLLFADAFMTWVLQCIILHHQMKRWEHDGYDINSTATGYTLIPCREAYISSIKWWGLGLLHSLAATEIEWSAPQPTALSLSRVPFAFHSHFFRLSSNCKYF